MTKTYIIHEIRPTLTSPGYRLEVVANHGRLGITLDFQTVWPDAAHPFPHRAMQLTLPPKAFGRLAEVIAKKGGA